MEGIIKKFLSVRSGDGYGDGSGSGSGDGYGDGSGSGSGSGYGSGYGSGDGIEAINGEKVYLVDGTQTIIREVHGNYAKGAIINSDLTLSECYIAKCGNYFAHGETLRQAVADAREKYEGNLPLKERIRLFNEKFPSDTERYSGRDFFEWHNKLTGSCLFGREQFCKDRGLDVDATYTVKEFIGITENAFGSNAIRQLKESRYYE